MSRPRLFIGSSAEGKAIAEAVQIELDRECEVELWSQGVFGLSSGTLESLVLALQTFDFAVLIMTADDMVESRGDTRPVARDNILFELGLFMGGLGRERTYMVFDRTAPPKIPSDLVGITAVTFEPHRSGNLVAALGAACSQIKGKVQRLGPRQLQRLSDAAETLEGASSKMDGLVRLLARSRKVELDIFSAQFGPLIDSRKLAEVRRDLVDLENLLNE